MTHNSDLEFVFRYFFCSFFCGDVFLFLLVPRSRFIPVERPKTLSCKPETLQATPESLAEGPRLPSKSPKLSELLERPLLCLTALRDSSNGLGLERMWSSLDNFWSLGSLPDCFYYLETSRPFLAIWNPFGGRPVYFCLPDRVLPFGSPAQPFLAAPRASGAGFGHFNSRILYRGPCSECV